LQQGKETRKRREKRRASVRSQVLGEAGAPYEKGPNKAKFPPRFKNIIALYSCTICTYHQTSSKCVLAKIYADDDDDDDAVLQFMWACM
jgi:hypothetical protein